MSPSYAVQPADMRDVAQLRRALEAAGLHPQARIREPGRPAPDLREPWEAASDCGPAL